jgi:hypothetical protein
MLQTVVFLWWKNNTIKFVNRKVGFFSVLQANVVQHRARELVWVGAKAWTHWTLAHGLC